MSALAPLDSLRAFEMVERRSQLTRLAMAAGFGNAGAAEALAEISADATMEHALDPGDPVARARYDETVRASAMYLLIAGSVAAPEKKKASAGGLPAVVSPWA